MFITLYGAEPFLAEQKLKEIIGNYKKTQQSGLSFYSFSALNDVDYNDFKSALDVVSMFAEKKLIVLKNFFMKDEALAKQVHKYASDCGIGEDKNTVVIFFESGEPKQGKEFKKLLEKPNLSQEFKKIDIAKLPSWIKKEFEKSNVVIESQAAALLARSAGDDMYRLKNEIDKLASYLPAQAGKKSITEKDVIDMVAADFHSDIFSVIDAIAKKDKKLSLEILNSHIEHGESEIYLLSMIVYQFRNLLRVKSLIESGKDVASIAKDTGLHPFVVKKTLSASKLFSLEELKNIYKKLFDIDLKIKIGEVDPQMALNVFVAEL